jgi:hypothetical protein
MTDLQQIKLASLVEKYNDILLHSMRLAVAEDLINLMLLNRDDTDFELKNLLDDKEAFYNFILKEFLKKNSSSVASQLRNMDDPTELLKNKVGKKKSLKKV